MICVNVKNPYSVLSTSEIFNNSICVRTDFKLGDCEKCWWKSSYNCWFRNERKLDCEKLTKRFSVFGEGKKRIEKNVAKWWNQMRQIITRDSFNTKMFSSKRNTLSFCCNQEKWFCSLLDFFLYPSPFLQKRHNFHVNGKSFQ